MSTTPKPAKWIFDALPPSGARRGGNPAEHAFKHKLATFVREVVQNANDQAKLAPRINFRLQPLKGKALSSFLAALGMDDLRLHLDAVASAEHGVALRRGLTALDESQELLVMYIEDRGTEGLTGAESEGESHFRALCKDTLFSHKKASSAGGSYGLGKSVLWVFSSLSTVLFDSTLLILPAGVKNPRFIGRAEFPSHEVGDKALAGSGWFGTPSADEVQSRQQGQRAESVWGASAQTLGKALGFTPREDHDVGTSICIVGFRDPTEDEAQSVERLIERTKAAVVENFWPAMTFGKRPLRAGAGVGAKVTEIRVDAPEVQPFVAAWRGRDKAVQELDSAGDVVVQPIAFRVPPTRDGEPAVDGHVNLIVRLDDERKPHARASQVAYFRGPGMVLKYHDRKRLALGMRAFHALVACGVARDPADVRESDHAIEHFLRLAEPPSHDRWESTQRLKDNYSRGYAKALTDLSSDIDDALRSLLTRATKDGHEGPERLQKRFPIGKKGRVKKREMAFRIGDLHASLGEDGWQLAGVIEPVKPGHAWTATLEIAEVDEQGRRSDVIPLLNVKVSAGAECTIEDGVVTVEAVASTKRLTFEAMSGPSPCVGALEVQVAGQLRSAP